MPDKQIADYLRQYCKGEYRAVTSRELKPFSASVAESCAEL